MLEQPPLGATYVAMVRTDGDAQALEDTRRACTQLEPAPVHAVAGAIDIAARDTLVRLHDVEPLAPPRGARGARKRPVAPHLADVEGINAQHAARAPALRLARDQRHLGAGALERRQRPGDEALGAAIGRVALAHDREPHFLCRPHAARASSSRAAAYTASTGSSVRHSLTLPPPQPSTRHGRQEWLLVIRRCSTFQGAHSSSLEGPKRATVGVPIAAARCIGIESTPIKSLARAASAPSSLIESLPARLTGFACARPMISSTNASSPASGAAVTTMSSP